VTWKGGAVNDRERAFRIIAEQLPVDFSGSGGEGISVSLSMQFKYEGSLYVSPRKAEPKVAAGIAWNGGKPYLVLENTGTGHLVMLEPSVVIRDSGGVDFALSTSDLEPIAGRNILAGGRRVLPVSLPSDFTPDKKLTVTFSSKRE
jgi:fimbrial chaperone protein